MVCEAENAPVAEVSVIYECLVQNECAESQSSLYCVGISILWGSGVVSDMM